MKVNIPKKGEYLYLLSNIKSSNNTYQEFILKTRDYFKVTNLWIDRYKELNISIDIDKNNRDENWMIKRFGDSYIPFRILHIESDELNNKALIFKDKEALQKYLGELEDKEPEKSFNRFEGLV